MVDILERTVKKAGMACFKVLSRHSPEGDEEYHEIPKSKWPIFELISPKYGRSSTSTNLLGVGLNSY
jgi:hypothetical protein